MARVGSENKTKRRGRKERNDDDEPERRHDSRGFGVLKKKNLFFGVGHTVTAWESGESWTCRSTILTDRNRKGKKGDLCTFVFPLLSTRGCRRLGILVLLLPFRFPHSSQRKTTTTPDG
jgi:hypothetical protein